jgi:hypothetical protein
MHNIMHTDHLMKILAEEAIEVAHGAANRWTGLPFTQVFHPPLPPPPPPPPCFCWEVFGSRAW